jgi:hypothetical protein
MEIDGHRAPEGGNRPEVAIQDANAAHLAAEEEPPR